MSYQLEINKNWNNQLSDQSSIKVQLKTTSNIKVHDFLI
jgi:hypothetical protein